MSRTELLPPRLEDGDFSEEDEEPARDEEDPEELDLEPPRRDEFADFAIKNSFLVVRSLWMKVLTQKRIVVCGV